jgi:hypothetical protein
VRIAPANMLVAMRIAIHIGAHKSASTTLQHIFALQHASLLKKGIRYVGPAEVQLSPLGFHVNSLRGSVPQESTVSSRSLELAQLYIAQLVKSSPSCDTLLFSWEGFLGHCALDVSEGFYPTAAPIAKSLADIFGCDCQLLIVARRQDHFIKSSWLQQLKEGRSRGFDTYCSKIHISNTSWLAIADAISQVFPSLATVPFEVLMLSSADEFLSACYRALGLGEVETTPIAIHANASVSQIGADAMTLVLPRIKDKKHRRATPKALYKLFTEPNNNSGGYFSTFTRAALLAASRDQNREFLSRYFRAEYTSQQTRQAVFEFWGCRSLKDSAYGCAPGWCEN